MPAGPVGSVWASGSWSATAWEAGVWADAEAPTGQPTAATSYRYGYRLDWDWGISMLILWLCG